MKNVPQSIFASVDVSLLARIQRESKSIDVKLFHQVMAPFLMINVEVID
jgi:hypothetical protein